MAEEITANAENEQDVQTTEPVGEADYEALYNKEKKYSQSMRTRAQDAEGKNDTLSLKAEEERQTKMIAQGKKDEVIQEQTLLIAEQKKRLAKFDKRDEEKKAKLLEQIMEHNSDEDKEHYEKMDLKQLEHFVEKEQTPDVSNPGQAVQGRTSTDLTVDSFMKESEDFKRDNFSDMVRKYDKNSSQKIKVT